MAKKSSKLSSSKLKKSPPKEQLAQITQQPPEEPKQNGHPPDRSDGPNESSKTVEPDEIGPRHVPSYVGLSCAIFGYGLYNRYDGSPAPSLQVSSLPSVDQVQDEVDSRGPVNRLIARFEKLKEEQRAKALNENKEEKKEVVEKTHVEKAVIQKRELAHDEEQVVIPGRGAQDVEQVAIFEHVDSEQEGEEPEDVSLVISESKSGFSQPIPVSDDRSESDTGSVRIHDTPEPSENQNELLFESIIQQQESPSPQPFVQSFEQETMKKDFPEIAQIVEQNEDENVEDELSTRVQVSDSNEEVLMREAPIESTSSRKTSIGSDGSNEVIVVKDGKWFVSQYELVCDEVRRKVTQAESDLDTFSDQMSDDVEGRVRAGVGKANLLITSKLKQFHDLCIKHIDNCMTDGCETKIEDLEGYWEMVSYQIEDVHHTFDEIDSMRHNNWTVLPELQFKEVPKPKPKSKKSASSMSAEDEEAAAVKEEARKARLREAKRLQAEKLAGAHQEEVLIFAPPTASETVSTPNPVECDPIVSHSVSSELIEIEPSTLTSDSGGIVNRPPSRDSEAVLVDLLS